MLRRLLIMAASIVISAEVLLRLSGICDASVGDGSPGQTDRTVLLVGRSDGSKVVGLGCAAVDRLLELSTPGEISAFIYEVVSLFPSGYLVVGLYKSSSNESAIEDGKFAFEQLTRSEACLAETSLAYVHFMPAEPVPKKAKIYDRNSSQFTECGLSVIEARDLAPSTMDFRVKGRLSVNFEASNDPELLLYNAEKAFDALKDRISSPACAFHFQKTSVLLSMNTSIAFGNDRTKCMELGRYVEDSANDDDGFQVSGKPKKNNDGGGNNPCHLEVLLLLQATGDEAVKQTLSCVPTIRYERKDCISIEMSLEVDTISTVSQSLPIGSLSSVLADGVCAQLAGMERCLRKFYEMKTELYLPKVYHFRLPDTKQIVSPIYPEGVSECELEGYRRELHRTLLLLLDRPVLRRSMRHHFVEQPSSSPYIRNPHEGLPPSGISNGVKATVQGFYDYHHYMQDRVDDNGWGCAYRSLQTIFSWFRAQGYTTEPVPTHVQCQQALVDVGDKPASFVNSKRWIGSMEVSYCLDQLIGVSSKIMSVSSGADLVSKGHELVRHFQTQGTPVMIGGGVLAHTILGVDFDESTDGIRFLVLDPHFTGQEDLRVIQSKGWCGWKGPSFWDKSAYYNLCCPQRPRGI